MLVEVRASKGAVRQGASLLVGAHTGGEGSQGQGMHLQKHTQNVLSD